MSFTYDLDTAIGQVRLLITDTSEERLIFSDAEIAAFLSLEGQDVRYSAAQALDTIASQQALLLKVIERLDLKTDGAKLAAELRARAKSLREQSDASVGEDADFDWAEQVYSPFGYPQRLRNELMRSGL